MAESESEAKRLRELDLNTLAERAIGVSPGSPQRQSALELGRRLIAESRQASRRLLFATWAIWALTAVLLFITALELIGVLG